MSRSEIDSAIAGMDSRKSKYGVDISAKGKEARTYEGIVYHSKREMEVYRDWIVPQMNVGIIRHVRRQVPFDLHVTTPGGFRVKIGTYKADWTALDRQDKLLILEAKGKPTALYERTKKHFEAEYGLRITEL